MQSSFRRAGDEIYGRLGREVRRVAWLALSWPEGCQSPSHSLELVLQGACLHACGRNLRQVEGLGSTADPVAPWHSRRAEIIPFHYMPPLLGGKRISHVGVELF